MVKGKNRCYEYGIENEIVLKMTMSSVWMEICAWGKFLQNHYTNPHMDVFMYL